MYEHVLRRYVTEKSCMLQFTGLVDNNGSNTNVRLYANVKTVDDENEEHN